MFYIHRFILAVLNLWVLGLGLTVFAGLTTIPDYYMALDTTRDITEVYAGIVFPPLMFFGYGLVIYGLNRIRTWYRNRFVPNTRWF